MSLPLSAHRPPVAAPATNPKLTRLLERSRWLSRDIASAFVFRQNGRFDKLCKEWDALNSDIFEMVEGWAA